MPPLLHRQAEAGGHRGPGRTLRAPLRQAGQEVALSTLPLAQRQALLAAKLRALVKAGWGDGGGDDPALEATFPGGVAQSRAGVGWVLAAERPDRALGAALTWARHVEVEQLHVLADQDTGLLARRAAAFARAPSVWQVVGAGVEPAVPDPPLASQALAPEVAGFLPLLAEAGVEAVVEQGVLTGEVLGLEVARVVVDGFGARLEVGVGRHDRDAQRLMHGDYPSRDVLARAVVAVRELRRPGARSHQVNQLARERWLRAVVVADPAMAGAAQLSPRPSPVRRNDLFQSAPAPAAGLDTEGRPVVVVCSTGVDLDLVPAAADARLADGRGARLVLVLPEPDDHGVTRALAADLAEPAEIVPVAPGWERALEEPPVP